MKNNGFDRTHETQAQFEARYKECRPTAIFGVNTVSMSCTCEDGGGPTHWAAIRNVPEMIVDHLAHEECLASLRSMK